MTLWRYCSRGWAKMSGRWPRKYQHHFSYSWANYCPKIILSKKATCEYSLCCVCKLCAILCTFFCSVSCILDTNSGEMTFSYTECEAPIILTVDTSCKLFPTLITTTKQEQLGDFIFTPVEGCQPLSSLLVPAKMVSAASTHPPPPPLLPAMKLTVLMWSCWRQLQDGLVASSIPAPATPMVSPTASMSTLSLATSLPSAFFSSLPSAPFSVPIPVPHCTSNMLLAATLPQVEKVMWLSEIVEQPKLLSFHLETLKTLRSMCLHGNTDAAKQVILYLTVSVTFLFSSLGRTACWLGLRTERMED